MSCLRSEMIKLRAALTKKQDSKPYGKAVYLNKEELKDTQEILSEGISIYIQQVPTSQIEHADFSK